MSAAVEIPRHTGDRFAARTRGREKVGHFLLVTWAEAVGRRGRPSLCGQVSRAWRNVAVLGEVVPACSECNAAAGIVPPPPVRLVPEAPRADPLRLASTDGARAHLVDPQHAHAALPEGWRPRNAPDVAAYVPPAQQHREELHAAHVGLIDFPDWAPLTYCRHG